MSVQMKKDGFISRLLIFSMPMLPNRQDEVEEGALCVSE
jgi:hypothetical protein